MTEREMLELAAKAVGINGWFVENDEWYGTCIVFTDEYDCNIGWSPLDGQADSDMLGVSLNMNVAWTLAEVWVNTCVGEKYFSAREPNNGTPEDKARALRLARLRVAAEVGKAMTEKG